VKQIARGSFAKQINPRIPDFRQFDIQSSLKQRRRP
jgi:hypothetical protein